MRNYGTVGKNVITKQPPSPARTVLIPLSVSLSLSHTRVLLPIEVCYIIFLAVSALALCGWE